MEDAAGASYFGCALNSAKLNTFSDARNPSVVLAADPTAACLGKRPAAGSSAAAGAGASLWSRGSISATTEGELPAGTNPSSGSGTQLSRERALLLAERATGKYARSLLTGVGAPAGAGAGHNKTGTDTSVEKDFAALSTDELLARSELLLREVQDLCAPGASARPGVADLADQADSPMRQCLSSQRFPEEAILAHATADVSTDMLQATSSKSSASWGGASKFDPSAQRYVIVCVTLL